MSFVFFNSILSALGKRINYDAVSNLAGNSFAKDAWQAIQSANPLYKESKLGNGFLGMISEMNVSVDKNKKKLSEGGKMEESDEMKNMLLSFGWNDDAKKDVEETRAEWKRRSEEENE